MSKLNEAFEEHLEEIMSKIRENSKDSEIDIDEALLKKTYDYMLSNNFNLYASTNYGVSCSSKKPTKKPTKNKVDYQWKFYSEDKDYSICKDIKEGTIFLRLNKNINKIIGTVGKKEAKPLTNEEINLLIKLKLAYDLTFF